MRFQILHSWPPSPMQAAIKPKANFWTWVDLQYSICDTVFTPHSSWSPPSNSTIRRSGIQYDAPEEEVLHVSHAGELFSQIQNAHTHTIKSIAVDALAVSKAMGRTVFINSSSGTGYESSSNDGYGKSETHRSWGCVTRLRLERKERKCIVCILFFIKSTYISFRTAMPADYLPRSVK